LRRENNSQILLNSPGESLGLHSENREHTLRYIRTRSGGYPITPGSRQNFWSRYTQKPDRTSAGGYIENTAVMPFKTALYTDISAVVFGNTFSDRDGKTLFHEANSGDTK
jgi:hypothetical protein